MTSDDALRERLLEQMGSTAQAAVEHGLTPADLHHEIEQAVEPTRQPDFAEEMSRWTEATINVVAAADCLHIARMREEVPYTERDAEIEQALQLAQKEIVDWACVQVMEYGPLTLHTLASRLDRMGFELDEEFEKGRTAS